MTEYWVVGGEYTDTSFTTIANGKEAERHGPYDDHDHALTNGIVGSSGSYAVPPAIETSTNVWVTIYLTATDSEGTSSTVSARVDPRIVTLTLDTDPGGLDVTLEGNQSPAPFSFQSVSGVAREIGAPTTQTSGGVTYTFGSWSDGLGQNEVRITPDVDTTITASYVGPTGAVCPVMPRDGGGITLTWQDKPGTEVIRNDAGWVTTPPPGTLSYDDPGGSLDEGWLIRRRGVDEVCTIEGDPPPPPPDPA